LLQQPSRQQHGAPARQVYRGGRRDFRVLDMEPTTMSTNTCSTLRTQPKHKHQGRLRRNLGAPLAALLCSTAPALAEEPAPERELPRLGMAPGEPQVRSAAPT